MIEMIFSGFTKSPDPVRAKFEQVKLDLVEHEADEHGLKTRREVEDHLGDGYTRLLVEIGDVPEGSLADPEAQHPTSALADLCVQLEVLDLYPLFLTRSRREKEWVEHQLRHRFTRFALDADGVS
ncbi:MAG: hypothetical protein M3R38_27160 [Actinomycetota bacterium]|nr:hypothetical protein [Actinomycetota bacterium]